MLGTIGIIISIILPILLIGALFWAAMKYGSEKAIAAQIKESAKQSEENKNAFEKVVANRPFSGIDAINRLRQKGHID